MSEYHLQRFEANEHWPKGGWSVYKITGDEIADRTVRKSVNAKGYYEGAVIARHSWPGFLGIIPDLRGLQSLIDSCA